MADDPDNISDAWIFPSSMMNYLGVVYSASMFLLSTRFSTCASDTTMGESLVHTYITSIHKLNPDSLTSLKWE